MSDLDEEIPGGGPDENHLEELPEDAEPEDVEDVPPPKERRPRSRGASASYCYGYSGDPQGTGQMLTIEQLMTKATVARMHPEFRRRVFALMQFGEIQGVPLGIGTGWRVQPENKPGFAQPGNSNHEGFPCDGGVDAVAADMVPAPSMKWMHANAGTFGLKTFLHVNNEPWHLQPIEIPNSRKHRRDPWVLEPFGLPGEQPERPIQALLDVQPAIDPEPGVPPYALNALNQSPPRMPNHTLKAESRGNEVVLLQVVLRRWHRGNPVIPDPGNPDGHFGDRTTKSLMAMQSTYLATTSDGTYGPVSHLRLQALSNSLAGMS